MDAGLTEADTGGLEREVRGQVLRPSDPGYDESRAVWNARFDSRPDVVVRCAGPEDVVAAIGFARDHALALTVKGGGHAYAGSSACRDGLLLDLSPMQAIEVDAGSRRARVQAGARLGQLDAATQAHGLVTPAGTVSTVGVGGLALGAGEGWLSRKYGLTLDNVVAAEVVTADGRVVQASADENPDLFWGVRGGGGNFGVVTTFEFALHEFGPDLLAGQVLYPIDRAPELLRIYRDYFTQAPDEVACFPFILRIPPIPEFPEAHHGRLALDFVVAYTGSGDGTALLAPFREQGDAILDTVATVPYLALQQAFDAGMGPGNRWYTRAHYFDALADEAIDTVVDNLDPFPGDFTVVYFGPGGGAVGRVAPDAMAYPHRTAAHSLHVFPGWTSPADDEAVMSWARSLHEAVAPYANGGVYVNLLAEDEAERVRGAYGANYPRLVELKKAWDPDNLFRGNQNIPPAG